jgi:hypothetical protein
MRLSGESAADLTLAIDTSMEILGIAVGRNSLRQHLPVYLR